MSSDPDEYNALIARYTAATMEERALWRQVNDPNLDPIERVTLYARWKAAADLIRTTAIKLQQAAIPAATVAPSR